MQVQLAQPADFSEVLGLQQRYHLSATSDDNLAEGFVTTTLTPETLQADARRARVVDGAR